MGFWSLSTRFPNSRLFCTSMLLLCLLLKKKLTRIPEDENSYKSVVRELSDRRIVHRRQFLYGFSYTMIYPYLFNLLKVFRNNCSFFIMAQQKTWVLIL
jgi:hypothetical protein